MTDPWDVFSTFTDMKTILMKHGTTWGKLRKKPTFFGAGEQPVPVWCSIQESGAINRKKPCPRDCCAATFKSPEKHQS